MPSVSRKKRGDKAPKNAKGKGGVRKKKQLLNTRLSGRKSAPKGEVQLLKPSEDDILKLLAAKVHVGREKAHVNMKRYIWKKRSDGVNIINLEKTWHKLVLAARIIVTVGNPADVMVLSTRTFGQRAAIKYASSTGATPVVGKWVNGSLTNPKNKRSYYEPRLIIVDDPRSTFAALAETSYVGIPVIAFCGTDNNTRFVDCAIPCNNRGKYSIGLLFWLLAREVLRLRGDIARTLDWQLSVDLFFYRDPDEIEKQQQKMLEDQQQPEEDIEFPEDGDEPVNVPVGPAAASYDEYAPDQEDWLEAPPEVGLVGWDGGLDSNYYDGYYDVAQDVDPNAGYDPQQGQQGGNLAPW